MGTVFSDKLKQFITVRDTKVAPLARYCGYDRSTMYKILNGGRCPASLENVLKIAAFLRLTPAESGELVDAYREIQMGTQAYAEFQGFLNFIDESSRLFEAPGSSDFIFTGKTDSSRTTSAINGYIPLMNALARLAVETKDDQISLVLQPCDEGFTRSLCAIFAKKRVNHLICLDNAGKAPENETKYNFNCLWQCLSLCCALDDRYEVHAYYQDASARFDNSAPFPFYAVSDSAVVGFGPDMKTGLYSSDTDIVAMFRRKAELLESVSHRLFVPLQNIMEECALFSEREGDLRVLQSQPCVLPHIEPEVLDEIMNADLPDREELCGLLNTYLKHVKDLYVEGDSVNYFNREGLFYFARTGMSDEVPSDFYRPLNFQQRRDVIVAMVPLARDGKYRLLRKELSEIRSNLYLSLVENELTIQLSGKNGKLFVCVMDETGFVNAFRSFFDNLDFFGYLESPEQTAAVMEEAISWLDAGIKNEEKERSAAV